MYNTHRAAQFTSYNDARALLLNSPDVMIALEKYCSDLLLELLATSLPDIKRDYDEASHLYAFWQNYPPDDRGRSPKGDQYPWIEVGEHAIGAKLSRLLAKKLLVRDTGLPSGADQRFILQGQDFKKITKGLTDAVWLFIDIKSVGPRDDAPHVVMSHNQISGDGLWKELDHGLKNTVCKAFGLRTSHDFHSSIAPIYVLSDATVAPVVIVAIKPVYKTMPSNIGGRNIGQPLNRIVVVSIPNGLLLAENPGYLKQYPHLLFPGKDDKTKNPLKIRARVSFDVLTKIAPWRVRQITVK